MSEHNANSCVCADVNWFCNCVIVAGELVYTVKVHMLTNNWSSMTQTVTPYCLSPLSEITKARAVYGDCGMRTQECRNKPLLLFLPNISLLHTVAADDAADCPHAEAKCVCTHTQSEKAANGRKKTGVVDVSFVLRLSVFD